MQRTPGSAIAALLAVCTVVILAPRTFATTLERMNVAKLVEYSELIVSGSVVGLTDGFDNRNLPYTEVTLQVEETVKGSTGGATYTFRQFGLMAPKAMGNGQVYLGVSPEGWPRFALGEEVIVFLHAKTSLGFQSAAGLVQGKFSVQNKLARNDLDNVGLFAGLSIDPSKLSEAETKMTKTTRGRCSAETFKGFVRKAVNQGWFDTGNAGRSQRGSKRDKQ